MLSVTCTKVLARKILEVNKVKLLFMQSGSFHINEYDIVNVVI